MAGGLLAHVAGGLLELLGSAVSSPLSELGSEVMGPDSRPVANAPGEASGPAGAALAEGGNRLCHTRLHGLEERSNGSVSCCGMG